MTMYYSPSSPGFYDDTFNRSIPSDVIRLTDAEYKYIFEELGKGKVIKVENNSILMVPATPMNTWADIRRIRNNRLSQCDYTQLPDYPGDKQAWAKYRQSLRDITETFNDPNEVVWAEKPKG